MCPFAALNNILQLTAKFNRSDVAKCEAMGVSLRTTCKNRLKDIVNIKDIQHIACLEWQIEIHQYLFSGFYILKINDLLKVIQNKI